MNTMLDTTLATIGMNLGTYRNNRELKLLDQVAAART